MPTRPFRIPLPPTRLQDSSSSPDSPLSPLSPPPISPRSPGSNKQLTPPPRLHLRSIIPSPPLPLEYLKTAPITPYPWIWRCHLCGSIYRLGATRRCLEDGHYFCSLPTPPVSPVLPTAEDFFSSLENTEKSGQQIIKDLASSKKRNKRSRKRATRGCRSEFDYAGWSKFNVWRREIAILNRRRLLKGAKGERSWKEARNCWKDCDFPSECHNERKAEREWEKQMKEIRASEEEWAKDNVWDHVELENAERPESALAFRIENEVLGMVEVEKKVPKDIGGEDVTNSIENLGPLGVDCDGLGEQVVQAVLTTKRRKSVDAQINGDSPPSSPLKECSFGFEDPATGIWSGAKSCYFGSKEKGKHLVDEDGDIQMEEVSLGKSSLLRVIEQDIGDERFGDEVAII